MTKQMKELNYMRLKETREVNGKTYRAVKVAKDNLCKGCCMFRKCEAEMKELKKVLGACTPSFRPDRNKIVFAEVVKREINQTKMF